MLEILAVNLMLRCILLIFRGTSIASLRMSIIGLVRNAPIAILIAWWCIGSSLLACRVVHDRSIVYLSSYYCSVCYCRVFIFAPQLFAAIVIGC